MKGDEKVKKTLITIAVSMGLMLTVGARGDYSYSYLCDIDIGKIPEGAVYIDMLMPLQPGDETYTAYNAGNGEKNKIPSDSEIVQYNEGGYRSYTFHIKSARSRIKPFQFEEDSIRVEYFADEEEYDRDSFDKIYEFGEKYRKVKFAYIDAAGNVITTTNEVDVWNGSGYADIFISISGEEVICTMEKMFSGIDFRFLLIPPVIGLLCCLVCFVIYKFNLHKRVRKSE